MLRSAADSGQEREEQRHATSRPCDVTTELSGGRDTSRRRLLGRLKQELQPAQHRHTERFATFLFFVLNVFFNIRFQLKCYYSQTSNK